LGLFNTVLGGKSGADVMCQALFNVVAYLLIVLVPTIKTLMNFGMPRSRALMGQKNASTKFSLITVLTLQKMSYS